MLSRLVSYLASGHVLPGFRSGVTWLPVRCYLAFGQVLPGFRSSVTWLPVRCYLASGQVLPGFRSGMQKRLSNRASAAAASLVTRNRFASSSTYRLFLMSAGSQRPGFLIIANCDLNSWLLSEQKFKFFTLNRRRSMRWFACMGSIPVGCKIILCTPCSSTGR